jgi:Uma2 family endonuclease
MVEYNSLQYLPTEEDLPETDNTPVDNELQILIPNLLRAILALLWASRMDWFLGVNLGIYYNPDKPAIAPDGFLSLGVPRRRSAKGRLSYVVWQENNVVPQWVLELVSKTPGGEYDDKMTKYAEMGVLYYTIYNSDYWKRDKHRSNQLFVEEMIRISILEKELFIDMKQIYGENFYKELKLIDIIRFQRLFLFLFWAFATYITSENLSRSKLFMRSTLPVFERKQFLDLLV